MRSNASLGIRGAQASTSLRMGTCASTWDIGGRSWFGYIFDRMEGLGSVDVRPQPKYPSPREQTPGDILQEVSETRLPPVVEGPVGRGRLEYTDVWKTAQRLAQEPVKLGCCSVQWIEMYADNQYYGNREGHIDGNVPQH